MVDCQFSLHAMLLGLDSRNWLILDNYSLTTLDLLELIKIDLVDLTKLDLISLTNAIGFKEYTLYYFYQLHVLFFICFLLNFRGGFDIRYFNCF